MDVIKKNQLNLQNNLLILTTVLLLNVEANSEISQQKNWRFKKNGYNYMSGYYMIA